MSERETGETKSKSQVKRELLALQAFGQQLLDLPDRSLDRLPLSEHLREAIMDARHMKLGARRRQVRYIGKLLEDEPVDALRDAVDALMRPRQEEVAVFHQLETWRDALLAGDDDVVEELVRRFEMADRQHLRQLVRNARREKADSGTPKSARALFRYLSELAHAEADRRSG